jgi:transcriptional regulator with XRE-family HTH domain
LTLEEVGLRAGVSRQAIQQFEKAEADDRITIARLRRIAGAMGCELKYVFVPKEKGE